MSWTALPAISLRILVKPRHGGAPTAHPNREAPVLDITEGYVRGCDPGALMEIERVFTANARRMLEAALVEALLPELDTEIRRERHVLPIGIGGQGMQFSYPR